MTVTSMKLCRHDAGMSEGNLKNQYTMGLLIESDDGNDDAGYIAWYVRNNGYDIGDTYAPPNYTDPMAVLKSIEPAYRTGSANPWIWDVVLEYDLPTPNAQLEDIDGKPSDNPLNWRWDVELGSAMRTIVAWQGWNYDGYPREPPAATPELYQRDPDTLGPIVASDGTVLDPPIQRDLADITLRVSGNLATYSDLNSQAILSSINSTKLQYSAYMIANYGVTQRLFDVYEVKCTQARGRFMFANATKYWNHTYEFRIRPRDPFLVQYEPAINGDGWLVSILDRSINRGARPGDPDGSGGTVPGQAGDDHAAGVSDTTAVRDYTGRRIGDLVLLDGRGQPAVGNSQQKKQGVWFRYRVDTEQDFNAYLPLDIFDPQPP